MTRQHASVRLLCGLILCSAMAACSDSSSPTGPTGGPSGPQTPQVVDRTVTLGINQGATIGDQVVDVTFRRVVSDNRCPGDAICVATMAGEAVLEFDLVQRHNGVSFQQTSQLSTNPARGSLRIGTYNVQLEKVMPYPFASQPPIQADEWRATLRITSVQN